LQKATGKTADGNWKPLEPKPRNSMIDPYIHFQFYDSDIKVKYKTTQPPKNADPIEIPMKASECGYIAEDVDDLNPDSFIVVLTAFRGEKLTPRLIKFKKTDAEEG